jgi:hypothetical protein
VKQEASEAEARKREEDDIMKREWEELPVRGGMVWNLAAKVESWRD